MSQSEAFKLLAVVAVDEDHQVRCQQPGCGRRVYASIHVVEDAGRLMVLGSDCFGKRYGKGRETRFRGYGAGGSGRLLTEAEREMLLNNTAALLAQFEAERAMEQERARAKLTALRALQAQSQPVHDLHQMDRARVEVKRRATETPQLVAIKALPAWAGLKKKSTWCSSPACFDP